MWPAVMCEFCYWKIRGPVLLLFVHPEMQILFQPLIGVLRLSICTRMISSGFVLLNLQSFSQCVHEFGCKAWIMVADDLAWEPIVGKHMFDIQPCNSFCCYSLLAWNQDYQLGAVMVSYCQYGIIPLQYR